MKTIKLVHLYKVKHLTVIQSQVNQNAENETSDTKLK